MPFIRLRLLTLIWSTSMLLSSLLATGAAIAQEVNETTEDTAAVAPATSDEEADATPTARDDPQPQRSPKQTVITVTGAVGEETFAKPFRTWTEQWREAAEQGDAEYHAIGLAESDASDRELLEKRLRQAAEQDTTEPLWLVMIGHGTFDGRTAKFNLRGRDVSAQELVGWVQDAKRPLVIVNGASSSGPFINRLSGTNRVVVTATKSGFESNYARFAGEMSTAILSGGADLNKDGQTSLLEAFLTASTRVAQFYEQEGRLATEHALLDDNGDKLGTPATFFRGARAIKSAKEGAEVDGCRALQIVLIRSEQEQSLSSEQRQQRDQLETQIAQLRDRKTTMDEAEYYRQLEALLTQLGEVLLPADGP